jgi:hypothetical protein
MILRRLQTAALLGASALASTASADWWDKWHAFKHEVHVDYHRNNCWPHPFREMAASSVMAPLGAMVDAGWRAQNTFGDELFRESDAELTNAGRSRLLWLATQSPVDRRVVYVFRGATDEITAARIASVNQELAQMPQGMGQLEVLVTDHQPPTGSGQMMTMINKARLSQLPPPVLRESGGYQGNMANGN